VKIRVMITDKISTFFISGMVMFGMLQFNKNRNIIIAK
jgi:hypothetical protein